MNLSIENVVNVSVSQVGQGVGEYNTSNLAVFTEEAYDSISFGSDGYKIYLEPSDVATDFGSSSETYKSALAVFSQQPNILAGGGYLVAIPLIVEQQLVAFSAAPTAGACVFTYGVLNSASVAFNDSLSVIEGKIKAISGLDQVKVTGSFAAGFTVKFFGIYGNATALTITSNTLVNGITPITETVTTPVASETLAAAITRTEAVVQYFGLMATLKLSEADLLAAAAVIQPLNKIGFFGSNEAIDLDPSEKFDLVRSASFYKTRCLFYGDNDVSKLIVMVASYAGRALSTNFNGSNTTQSMHLKDLSGVVADATMTQTLLNKALAAGVDTYISIQGVSKTFTSGLNRFFDDVYNLQWFIGSIQIAGFNVLAQTSTKIAQTENGVDSLKSAYRKVCEQAVTNQFLAPNSWTSPNTFGVQADFFANILERGYYIYSLPVALQLPSARENRDAPIVQIAVKYAGSIHSSDVIVNINR